MRLQGKKISLFFLLALVCCSLLFSEPVHYGKGLKIQGGYDDVAAINITPLAQAEGYLMGMPFSLDDSSVKFGVSEKGRLIAHWNVLTNRRFLIDVNAEIMHPENEENTDKTAYDNGLGYILKFVFNMSYYAGGKAAYINNGTFLVEVPDSISSKKKIINDIDLLKGIELDDSSLVGNADGDIYFVFDESTTAMLGNEVAYSALPDGNYLAKVILTLKVQQ